MLYLVMLLAAVGLEVNAVSTVHMYTFLWNNCPQLEFLKIVNSC